MTPLSLLVTQNLINRIVLYFDTEAEVLLIVMWFVLLILSMFLVSCTGFINGVQNINMKRQLDEKFTLHIMKKYILSDNN